MHIVTTTNEIDTYYTFLPSSYLSWKKMFPDCIYVLGLITEKEEDSFFVKRAREFCDKMYIYKPTDGIESGVQAKTTRMYLTTLFKEEVCIIVDIDYYILNKEWMVDKIKPAVEDGKFVTVGGNGYDDTDDAGKWQMTMTTAKSSIFEKILNPGKIDNCIEWMESFKEIEDPIDNKESVSNKFDKFSDESLFRYIVIKHKDPNFISKVWVKQDREDFVKMKSSRRVDRGFWGKSFEKTKMEEGFYIDCQPLRPFDLFYKKLKPVLEVIGVDVSNEDNLFFKKRVVRKRIV